MKKVSSLAASFLAVLLLVSCLAFPVAFAAGADPVTSTQVPDAALLSTLKQIITGSSTGTLTISQLNNYTGVLDLKNKNIVNVTGLSMAYSAQSMDLSGNPIISIPDMAFTGCLMAESIVLPTGVVSIGEYAFSYCMSLKNFTIPASVTTIGSGAFMSCSEVTTISIPNGVQTLPESCFESAEKLASVAFGTGLKTIGVACFKDCYALASVTLPNSVTSLGTSVFEGCSALNEVTFSTSLTALPERAFYNCIALEEIYPPSNIKTFGKSCFAYCTNLANMGLSNQTTALPDSMFESCSSLQLASLPINLQTIGNRAFYKCTSLLGVGFPDTVVNIGEESFANCTNLLSINLPTTMSVSNNAFNFCHRLTEFIIRPVPEISYLKVGKTSALTLNCFKSGSWSSTDTNVATVNASGVATGVAEGPAYIKYTGTFAGLGATAPVTTVTASFSFVIKSADIEVSSIDISPTPTPLRAGRQYHFFADVLPANATDKTITWSTSDPAIAEFDSTGLLTVKKDGVVTLTAQAGAQTDSYELTCYSDVVFKLLSDKIMVNGVTKTIISSATGQPIMTDITPRQGGGKTMVPLRALTEGFGATVTWDGSLGTQGGANIVLNGYTLLIPVGSRDITKINNTTGDSTTVKIPNDYPAAALLTGYDMFVPLRIVTEATGFIVDYQGQELNEEYGLMAGYPLITSRAEALSGDHLFSEAYEEAKSVF